MDSHILTCTESKNRIFSDWFVINRYQKAECQKMVSKSASFGDAIIDF